MLHNQGRFHLKQDTVWCYACVYLAYSQRGHVFPVRRSRHVTGKKCTELEKLMEQYLDKYTFPCRQVV